MTAPATVACLVCTSRPEWEPFWRHQIDKQMGQIYKATFVEADPPEKLNIAQKRTRLLRRVFDAWETINYFAFFDDDDWSDPCRLINSVSAMQHATFPIAAVGSRDSHFVNARTRESRYYEAPEGIIFNGAVFRRDMAPPSFNAALTVGEDTAWLKMWQANKPTYVITHGQHLWLSHERNTTNRITEHAFEDGPFAGKRITPEEWALVPKY